MRAQRIDGQTPGGKRQRLADRLPLDTPFSIQVFPVYACNLACAYCIHSVPLEERGFIAAKTVLDMGLYRKFIADLAAFPRPLKMLRFAGTSVVTANGQEEAKALATYLASPNPSTS